jgi:metallophosphoesterase superfamily enzyme
MWLQNKRKTTKTVIAGDICDHHGISFHAANPMCPGPNDEYKLTLDRIRKWYQTFPNAYVTLGNHDTRIVRLAESVNIPPRYLRDYKSVWRTPKWKWVEDVRIDDVYYFHGIGRSGKTPAYNAMQDFGMSCVMGHCHSASGFKWRTSPAHRQFGMDVGCGIDVDAWQFAYGKHMRQRPVLSAGVVIDGIPEHYIMPCGPGEEFHKSKFKRR